MERVLTLQDFDILQPSASSPSVLSDNPSRAQVITAPSVTMLTMPGRWSLSDEIVEVLSETVFPNLSHLMMREASGFSLEGWVSVLRSRPLLKKALCGRRVTEELRALGLIWRQDPLFQETSTEFEDPIFYFLFDRWCFRKAGNAASEVDILEQ